MRFRGGSLEVLFSFYLKDSLVGSGTSWMSARVWFPNWVSRRARSRVASGGLCDCPEFCFRLRNPGAETPLLREVCPFYFYERPEVFQCSSRTGALDFVYLPWDVPTLKSCLIRFEENQILFEFGWEPEGSNDFRDYYLERVTLFRDRPDAVGVRLPRGLPTSTGPAILVGDLWERLGEYLNLVLVVDSPTLL